MIADRRQALHDELKGGTTAASALRVDMFRLSRRAEASLRGPRWRKRNWSTTPAPPRAARRAQRSPVGLAAAPPGGVGRWRLPRGPAQHRPGRRHRHRQDPSRHSHRTHLHPQGRARPPLQRRRPGQPISRPRSAPVARAAPPTGPPIIARSSRPATRAGASRTDPDPPPAVPAARLTRWVHRHPPRGFASRNARRYTKPRGGPVDYRDNLLPACNGANIARR